MEPRVSRLRTQRTCACPVATCGKGFTTPGKLAQHLRSGVPKCTIRAEHRPTLTALKVAECEKCQEWFASQSIATHLLSCRVQDSPDGSPAQQPPPAPGHLSDPLANPLDPAGDSIAFLNSLSWVEVGRCPYSTLTVPRGALDLYREAHQFFMDLWDAGRKDEAWKLHFFLIRVLFAPTTEGRKRGAESATHLVKDRCRSFIRGEWEYLWEMAGKAPVMGTGPVQVEGADPAQASRRDLRARALAQKGELSKAMGVFASAAILDPEEPSVRRQLEKLHAPKTRLNALPDEPSTLHDDEDEWGYAIRDVQIPGDGPGGHFMIDSLVLVHGLLRDGVAQSLSGARYEHYKALPVDVVRVMAEDLLNGRPSDGPRSILTSCRGLALDKGGAAARPVAIGEALRRIAGRVVCVQDNEAISATLQKVRQFGVAVKGGIEYAYASVRLHMLSSFEEYEENWESFGEELLGEEDIPGGLKVDYTNGYGSTDRARMLAEVQEKFPELLRFTRFCYADRPAFVVMSKGKVVVEIATKFGTQQGDPLGGHLFALSIYKFMFDLKAAFPHACISWIVDDLTVSASQGTLAKVADFIDKKGPEYGLFKHATKGEFYSPYNRRFDPDWKPLPIFHKLKYIHAKRGFAKLLGAPFGDDEFMSEAAVDIVKALVAPAAHLFRIQQAQLEFQLLRHCVCSTAGHLCRMLAPHVVEKAIEFFESVVKREADRIIHDPGSGTKLGDGQGGDWGWAKLPISSGGLGLHDLSITAPAAHMASMGGVARRAAKLAEDDSDKPAAVVRQWFDKNAEFKKQLENLAAKVNRERLGEDGAAHKQICPSLPALEEMPSQKKLSAPLVKSRQEFLLSWSASHDSTADQAWKISRCQFNAGSWLAAIPSLKKFKCTSNVFKIMLQLHLGLALGVAGSVSECQGCKASEDILSLRNGRHWTTRCNKAWRNKTHNKLRDEIEAMFTQGLGAHADHEQGRYDQLRSDNSFKPADVIRYGDGGDQPDLVMDVTIGDPSCPTYIKDGSNSTALIAAGARHKKKMDLHHRRLGMLEARDDFIFSPLAFEATGAMGLETQEWWKKIVKEDAARRKARDESSNRLLNQLPATWAANSFSTFWLQSFSMAQARTQAHSIDVWVQKSTPHRRVSDDV